MAIDAASFFANLAIAAATAAYTQVQSRKNQAEQNAAAAARAFGNKRDIAAGDYLTEVYGDAVVQGKTVYARRTHASSEAGTIGISNITGFTGDGTVLITGATKSGSSVVGDDMTSFGSLDGQAGGDQGYAGQYLIAEEAICVGTISECRQILFDDLSAKVGGEARGNVIAEVLAGGTVSSAQAAAQRIVEDPATSSRANAIFLNIVHSWMAVKHDVDDPVFFGQTPRTLYFVRQGMRRTMSAGALAAEADNDNLVAGFIHYYTKSLIGPQRPDSELHLPSLQASWDIADMDVEGPGTTIPTSTSPTKFGYTTFLEYAVAAARRGMRSQSFPEGLADVKVKRYAAKGEIPSNLTFPEAIDLFLVHAPGAQTFVDFEGKRRFVMPNPDQTAAAQSTFTVTEDDLVDEEDIHVPDINERYNRVIGSFYDTNLDGAVNTVVQPKPGSAFAVGIKEDDGDDRVLHLELPLADNEGNAASICMTTLLLSRRAVFSLPVSIKYLDVARGDIGNVKLDYRNVDDHILVTDVTAGTTEDTLLITGFYFEPSDFDYWPLTVPYEPPVLAPRLQDPSNIAHSGVSTWFHNAMFIAADDSMADPLEFVMLDGTPGDTTRGQVHEITSSNIGSITGMRIDAPERTELREFLNGSTLSEIYIVYINELNWAEFQVTSLAYEIFNDLFQIDVTVSRRRLTHDDGIQAGTVHLGSSRGYAHPGRPGVSTILPMSDIGSPGNDGGYRFVDANDINLGGGWISIHARAAAVRIGKTDRDGNDITAELSSRRVNEILFGKLLTTDGWLSGSPPSPSTVGATNMAWISWTLTRRASPIALT